MGILVEIYDNCVEIINPGRLLFDKSKFGKLSVARNPIIFDAFYRLGITEKIGSGIARMREAMAERGIEIAFDTGDFFIVTLTRPETARKKVTDQVTDQVKKLLKALKTGKKSGKELIDELKLRHKPTFRMNYLKPAIKAGLIELTIPEKPKSRFQKYRLTDKGKAICELVKQNKDVKPKKSHPEHDPYLIRIKKGERLYKFYYFRPIAGLQYHFEYRILTKEKINGMLEMVSYNFKIENGVPQKSSITRVPKISKEQLEEIVQNVMIKTNTGPDEFEELDLSRFSTIDEQIEFLKRQDRVDTMYIM